MSGIRVYEAARKLNIETRELMRILEERGAPAKSPIAFISQSDFDDILDYLTTGEKSEAGGEGPEPRISLVQPAAEAGPETERADVIPFSKPAEKGEKTPRREKPAPKEKTAPPPPQAASAGQARTWSGQTILSFLALGVASAAMLIALVMNTYIEKNTAAVGEALSAAGALEGEIGSLADGVSLNESMIIENSAAIARAQGAVEAERRGRVRDELLNRSAALEELSAALPADAAARLRSVSSGLRGLAGAIR